MNITVIGAGSWGTALAVHLARSGHDVNLCGRADDALDKSALSTRSNERYLPGITFPDTLHYRDWHNGLKQAEWILIATPSHAFADTLHVIQRDINKCPPIAWASKGLQQSRLLDAVASDIVGDKHPLAVLSGPTFASELAQGLPTAITVAGNQPAFTQMIVDCLHGQNFRAYSSTDMIGVQIGGAVKNIMAIAAGASDGLGFGANARTALITRGLAEITRLGLQLGAEQETFMGLAGLGDLVLTCSDNQSRNRRFGLALAQGLSPDAAERSIGQVVEGRKTTREVYTLAQQLKIDMPIVDHVWQVLNGDLELRQAVQQLLERPAKAE